MHIEDNERLVTEIEMLKVVLYLVLRKRSWHYSSEIKRDDSSEVCNKREKRAALPLNTTMQMQIVQMVLWTRRRSM
jgi:hypothetical protein